MSKYNKLPGETYFQDEPIIKEAPKLPISKLCCLPIFMSANKNYKRQLNQIMSLEELMPKTQRLQIYQMMYMDKLLDEIREYRPEVKDTKADPMEFISKMDKTGSMSKMVAMMTSMKKYQETKDTSVLMEMLMPNNPMLSMLLPMMSQKTGTSQGGGGNMMEALLPMMMGQNSDMLSSLLGGML